MPNHSWQFSWFNAGFVNQYAEAAVVHSFILETHKGDGENGRRDPNAAQRSWGVEKEEGTEIQSNLRRKPESINPGLGDQADKTRWRTGSGRVLSGREQAEPTTGTTGRGKVLKKSGKKKRKMAASECGAGKIRWSGGLTWLWGPTVTEVMFYDPTDHMTPKFHWGNYCNPTFTKKATRNADILIYFTTFVL